MEKIGIIGGGQLAYFLAEAAMRLGFEVVALAHRDDVIAQCAGIHIVEGSPHDPSVLNSFFSGLKTVIFENEWLDMDLLEKQAANKISFYPHLSLMKRLQNKLHQKQELEKLGIPTTPYVVINNKDTLEKDLLAIKTRFGENFVLKWSLNGYDGKGVFLARHLAYADDEALDFCLQALEANSTIYAEPLVDFKMEVALVAVRSIGGDFTHYPLVISQQSHGTCYYVHGPAHLFDVPAMVEQVAVTYARKLADSLNVVGTFAIEFFLKADNTLLVNEIAPRVHNTGHFTIDAANSSQFDNHIRAVTGMDLISPTTKNYFAMLNLLGPQRVKIDSLKGYQPSSLNKIAIHWYGKQAIRPKRKMGHATIFANNKDEYISLKNALENFDNKWKLEMEKIYEK